MERVRFAPSPTGPLHIGGLRTALFNYLFARKQKGVFILRVEDTDQNRKVDGSEKYIQETLSWCNIIPDEGPEVGGNYGPYRQSERKGIYEEHILKLIEKGSAYYAFDSNEQLSKAREESEKLTGGFKYGASNRKKFSNSLTENKEFCEEAIEKGNYVVRLKVNPAKDIVLNDIVRGTIRVKGGELEDKILMKADGMPTYHFANVVDDHLMKISTVIRGEEWLPSLATHQLLYDAFGWETPKFMHLPLILNPSGKGKLSKRDGDKNGYPVFPMSWQGGQGYKENGFIAEALLNYIAQLGWSLGDDEIRTLEGMEKSFDAEEVQKAGARFDYEKARWVNQQHLSKMTSKELIDKFPEYCNSLNELEDNKEEIIEIVKDRLVLLSDIKKETLAFIAEPVDYDVKGLKRINKFDFQAVGRALITVIEQSDVNDLKESISEEAKRMNMGMGAFMQVLRMGVVGALSGPDIISMVRLIGKDVTLRRVQRLINET